MTQRADARERVAQRVRRHALHRVRRQQPQHHMPLERITGPMRVPRAIGGAERHLVEQLFENEAIADQCTGPCVLNVQATSREDRVQRVECGMGGAISIPRNSPRNAATERSSTVRGALISAAAEGVEHCGRVATNDSPWHGYCFPSARGSFIKRPEISALERTGGSMKSQVRAALFGFAALFAAAVQSQAADPPRAA